MPNRVRDAAAADGAICASIYAPYVRDTVITFETVAPSADEMSSRIASAQARHAWLVVEDGDGVFGYAYAHEFAPRAAYQWACEVSVYLAQGRSGTGAGSGLYEALLPRLARLGHRRALAGVALPNEPSIRLHARFGFEAAGLYRRIGWKLNGWRDVAWYQRDLSDETGPPTIR